jgi:hypothetical protein
MRLHNKIELTHGSAEWHAWCAERITDSDVPGIMGLSLYETRAQTIARKLGLLAPHEENYGMRLHNLYPSCYECVLDGVPFGALLREVDRDEKHFVDVKCTTLEVHENALKGIVPIYQNAQIQAQIIISGINSAEYITYNIDSTQRLSKNKIEHCPYLKEEIIKESSQAWEEIKYVKAILNSLGWQLLTNDKQRLDALYVISDAVENRLYYYGQEHMPRNTLLSIKSWLKELFSSDYSSKSKISTGKEVSIFREIRSITAVNSDKPSQ